MINTSAITANSRDLVVQLSRGNSDPARALAESIRTELNTILNSGPETDNALKHKARQTMFAVEEVLALVNQGDIRGAWEAACDAAKEWRATARD